MESPSFEKIEFSEEAKRFKESFRAVLDKDPGLVAEKIAKFVRGTLWKTHTPEELHEYEAYCIIVGSTPLVQPEHFDLEGDESIVQFVERLENEIEE